MKEGDGLAPKLGKKKRLDSKRKDNNSAIGEKRIPGRLKVVSKTSSKNRGRAKVTAGCLFVLFTLYKRRGTTFKDSYEGKEENLK